MNYRSLPLIAVLLLFFSLTAAANGDTDDAESEEESPVAAIHTTASPTIQPGILLQTVASFKSEAPDGANGFSLAKARVNLAGTVDRGWDYFVQTDFASSLSLLDARIRYQADAPLGIATGMYKVPFSQEWLTSAAAIDFVRRSRVVAALSPKRDIGVTLTTNLGDAVALKGGVFNGNGRSLTGNDNNRFLYAARMEVTPDKLTESLTTGVNIAYNQSSQRSNDYRQLLVGADLRLTPGSLLVSAEAIYGDRTLSAFGDVESFGYHATAGYTLETEIFQQILVRLDQYSPDLDAPGSTLLVAGYNINPSEAVGVQINYLVPTDSRSFDDHQLLIDLQLVW